MFNGFRDRGNGWWLGHVAGIDGIAHFDEAGLEVGGGELAEGFAGDEEVGGALAGAAGSQNGAGFDLPRAVTLNQDEAFVGRDRGDPADQLRRFRGGLVLGFMGRVGGEDRTGAENRAGEGGEPQDGAGVHGINLLAVEILDLIAIRFQSIRPARDDFPVQQGPGDQRARQAILPQRCIEDPDFVGLEQGFQAGCGPQ